MTFTLYPPSTRNSKLKDEGLKKRAALLKLMPDEFTTAMLAEAAGITKSAAMAQIQKMVHWKQIEPTTSYQNPRTYRKMSVYNSDNI